MLGKQKPGLLLQDWGLLTAETGTGMLAPRPQSASAAGKVSTGREFKLETKSYMLEDVLGPSNYNQQNCERATVFNNRKTV